MARKVLVVVVCDICAAAVDEGDAMQFGLGGVSYTADLCTKHVAELTDALEPFIGVGQVQSREPVDSRPPRAATRGPARRDPQQTAAIRTWATSNGFNVAPRGRIPAEVEAAYNTRRN